MYVVDAVSMCPIGTKSAFVNSCCILWLRLRN